MILGQTKCGVFGSHQATANYLPFEVIDREGVIPADFIKKAVKLVWP